MKISRGNRLLIVADTDSSSGKTSLAKDAAPLLQRAFANKILRVSGSSSDYKIVHRRGARDFPAGDPNVWDIEHRQPGPQNLPRCRDLMLGRSFFDFIAGFGARSRNGSHGLFCIRGAWALDGLLTSSGGLKG